MTLQEQQVKCVRILRKGILFLSLKGTVVKEQINKNIYFFT